MATFGERLKKLRENKKYSQIELAKRFNLSQSTIAYYEQDKKQPSHATLQGLADLFDVSTDYLLGRTDDYESGTTRVGEDEEVYKAHIHIPEGSVLSEIDPELARKMIEAMNDPLEELFFDDILSASKEEREELIREFLKMRKEKKRK